MPRRIVAAVAAKFGEVEKRLRMKPNSIEEVADQRQFVEALPRKVAELVAEMDAAQVLPTPLYHDPASLLMRPVHACQLLLPLPFCPAQSCTAHRSSMHTIPMYTPLLSGTSSRFCHGSRPSLT